MELLIVYLATFVSSICLLSSLLLFGEDRKNTPSPYKATHVYGINDYLIIYLNLTCLFILSMHNWRDYCPVLFLFSIVIVSGPFIVSIVARKIKEGETRLSFIYWTGYIMFILASFGFAYLFSR